MIQSGPDDPQDDRAERQTGKGVEGGVQPARLLGVAVTAATMKSTPATPIAMPFAT